MASNGSLAHGSPSSNSLQAVPQITVHSFDPDATPAQKAAAAGRSRDKLESIIPDQKPTSDAKGLAVDTGHSNIVPTITVEDTGDGNVVHVANGVKLPHGESSEEQDHPPGAIPVRPADAIPQWFRVGWREMSGIDRVEPEGEAKDLAILDLFISEQFYGDWYHNAAVIVFAVLATHFLTRFNFGWAWVFIVLAFCCTYYTTSMERLRRRLRDDIQRELVKTRLASESETADWINNFLDRFWLLYEPVLSQSIIQTVDQVLSVSTPAFLDSMRLGDFTLGTKAPRIESVRTSPKTEDDVVMMDWTLSFIPNDVSNMTPKQAANKVNPKIVLQVRLGKGIATASMPILVEDITFKGSIKLRLKLMSNFPHVQVVDLSFVEKPVIDFVLKPIGGDTFGFDIANIPGLKSFIHEMTHATLEPMMYAPNVFTLNLEQMLSGKPLDAAIGIVKITLYAARGIKAVGIGSPDPYVSINIQNRPEIARTKYKHNTLNPTWSETKFVVVNNLDEDMMLNVRDYNELRKDTLLGTAKFNLKALQEDATLENIASQLLRDGKDNGEIKFDISYYPVLTPEEKDGQLPDSNVGIVRLVIHQAKELDHSKCLSGELNPSVKVYIGKDKSAYKCPVRKHTNNPIWEAPYEFLCTDKTSSKLALRVIDDRDFSKDLEVGYMAIALTDLLACTGQAGKDWFQLSNCKSGKIRVSAEWKPLNMAGALQAAEKRKQPIGVVRLHLDRATDVKNVEAGLGGKSDPYVRVLVNGVVKGRTEVINNNLSPVWDEIIYIPVHSLKETLLLECMDYQHLTKDRPLGSVEVNVFGLATTSEDPQYPFKSTGKKEVADKILVERDKYKGVMHYAATFIPAMHVKGSTFKPVADELHRTAHEKDADKESISSGSSTSLPEDGRGVTDITIHLPEAKEKTDTPVLSQTDKPAAEDNEDEDKGIEMTKEELLAHQSGIILFNVISGTLHRKARVEVLLDDGYWPCFSTTRARSTNAYWEYFGEGFMKELDWGLVWLRLNEADEGDSDDVVGVWKGDAKDFLKSTLGAPQTFTLHDPHNDDKPVAKITVEARYVPVPVVLEPRETVNNQGLLRVVLLNGQEIQGVDQSGKSDPFAVFTLNGNKVFKSQVKKKTLTPEWNEEFSIDITSRSAADFSLELFDWNQFEQAKSLGTAKINIVDVEAFQASNQTVTLSGKHGEKGRVQLNLLFQPRIIAKTRKNTSTFTSAGRAMTQLGGLPINAGRGVLQGVTSVFKHKDHDRASLDSQSPIPPVPTASAAAVQEAPTNNSLEPSLVTLPTKSSIDSNAPPSNEPGALKVVVVSAALNDESKAYVVLRVGDKEVKTKHSIKTTHPEWNEPFHFAAGPLTAKLHLWLHEHKSFGKDKDLGEADIDLWANLQLQAQSSKEMTVPLRGGAGSVKLNLEFDPTYNPLGNGHTATASVGERIQRTVSITSPSRFSLRTRRPDGDD